MTVDALHAMARFGLGRAGVETLPGDPRAWLLGQVDGPDPAKFDPTLPSTADGLTIWREQIKLKIPGPGSFVASILKQDTDAQTNEALGSSAPFRERLVWFWANHFTVSTRAGGIAAVVGPYVREAIRPNITGSFLSLLLAVMRHPAMLMYLDNAGSVGPNSVAGLRSHRGLNENLARECMELHTLGVDAGYTQADVTSFARVLTGWSVELNAVQPGFVFRPETHEPGEKTVFGRRFPPGEAGGVLALDYLANHPTTHRHLARKLVQHFVADVPPPDQLLLIEGVLRDTTGDLGAASRALVDLPGAWQGATKLRSPADFVIAAARALDLPEAARPPMAPGMGLLGQPLWSAASWAAPEAMMRRIDWSYGVSGRAAAIDPEAMAEAALGPHLRPETRQAMQGAGSRRDAIALLLTAAEFQRR
jgi:uncharacterized protein (DUF1800 family)